MSRSTSNPLQVQPRIWFAFFVHCWLGLSYSSRTPRSLSARLLLNCMDPSLYWAPWLCHPRCRTLHLSLLSFIQFLLVHSTACWGLQDVSPFRCVCLTTQFNVTKKCSEGAFNPVIHIIYGDAEMKAACFCCVGIWTSWAEGWGVWPTWIVSMECMHSLIVFLGFALS